MTGSIFSKFVTVGGLTWFSMHDTPEEAQRVAEQDSTGMVKEVQQWRYQECPNGCTEVWRKSTVWIKPIGNKESI